ncbi:LacI family DNA-binding transcriptional regulator [Tsukamurella ocularis]|uniref:LacI family DNA-binding transcriptional regulator n=1 Tax=Tsukamurella ocularis TaxID=1970234 RepID=UPI0039F08FD0
MARRPTMADVATAAGVSTALVSIIFRDAPGASDETRERVKRIADELGYVPDRHAQKLRQARSGLIGVTFELQQPFHGDLVEQLYPQASSRGYDLVLSGIAPTRDESAALDALVRERCEAVILLGSRLTPEELDRLAKKVPVEVVARAPGTDAVGAVRMNDGAGITLAVDHLTGLGHRRIAYIDGGDAPGSDDRAARFRSYTDTLGVDGLVVPGGSTETDGVIAMTRLRHEERSVTAVMAFNDRVATGVLDDLLRNRIGVPDDVSVVGYDDSRLSRLGHIRLTTIAQATERIAAETISSVIDRLHGGSPSDVVLSPHLIERRTTGPAKA